jgi:hypothetical protein
VLVRKVGFINFLAILAALLLALSALTFCAIAGRLAIDSYFLAFFPQVLDKDKFAITSISSKLNALLKV